jgi:hypothetical protein
MIILASTPTALTTPPCRKWPVADPDECQQGRLEIHKIGHIIPNNEKKGATTRKCSLLSKWRKETSVICLSFGVAFCKTPCFSKYHTKKNYQTGTQKLNTSPDRYSNISFKKML